MTTIAKCPPPTLLSDPPASRFQFEVSFFSSFMRYGSNWFEFAFTVLPTRRIHRFVCLQTQYFVGVLWSAYAGITKLREKIEVFIMTIDSFLFIGNKVWSLMDLLCVKTDLILHFSPLFDFWSLCHHFWLSTAAEMTWKNCWECTIQKYLSIHDDDMPHSAISSPNSHSNSLLPYHSLPCRASPQISMKTPLSMHPCLVSPCNLCHLTPFFAIPSHSTQFDDMYVI